MSHYHAEYVAQLRAQKDEQIAALTAERDALLLRVNAPSPNYDSCCEERDRVMAERDALKARLEETEAEALRNIDHWATQTGLAMKRAVLDALGKAWERSPDQRLCQLVYNYVRDQRPEIGPCPQLFYMKDAQLLAALEAWKR